MPMATAVTFSSNTESFMSPVGLGDFQNSNYVPSSAYEDIHIRSEAPALQRLPSDHFVNNPVEPYRGAAMEETYNPRLIITEQPKSKWRYRYGSEKGSHGGLPGVTSTTNHKTFPTVKLLNFNECQEVYVRASLCTDEGSPKRHVHKLCGPKCEPDGTCTIKLNEDKSAIFQDITILFVAKKEVSDVLFQRRLESHDMTSVSDAEKRRLKEEADRESKIINLNSVRICFEAFYYGSGTSDCVFLCREYSNPVANQKSPDAGDLKICRMSRVSGSVFGGDDVFLLVSKVNKRDVKIRFYESDTDWEAFGTFTEADVHYQYAIVFQTPQYRRTDITSEVTVFLQLQRGNGEVSEAKKFTYVPHVPDDERIGRKRKKNNPYQEFDGSGGGLYSAVGSVAHNAHGNVHPAALGREPINGSSFGNSSNCTSQRDGLDKFLMDMFDEDIFDDIPDNIPYEPYSESSSADDSDPLVKPGEDPLLSEANVQRPKWNLSDTPRSIVHTHKNSSPDLEKIRNQCLDLTGNLKLRSSTKESVRVTEELFSKLSLLKDNPEKNIIGSNPCSVNPNHLSDVDTRGHCKKAEHCDSSKEYLTFKKTKRIWNSLAHSVRNGNPFFFMRSLQHLVNFSNEDGDTLLHLAVLHQWHNLDLVENLLKVFEGASGSPVNQKNKEHQTPLHLAVIMQKHSIVKLLLQYGADPSSPDSTGCTPIHLAVNNSTKCLYEILDYRKSKNLQKKLHLEHFNHEGLTPLHCAVIKTSLDCVSLLCHDGADVNVPSKKDGRAPLHFAVDKDISGVKLLLKQKNINVNAQDYGGNTALHLACAMRRCEVVRELMLQDANPLIENFEDDTSEPGSAACARTPYDFAAQDKEIINILAGTVDQQFQSPSNFSRCDEWQEPTDSASCKLVFPSCSSKETAHSDVCLQKKSELQLNDKHHASQGDSGFISGPISVLGEETLEELCKLLDPPSNGWKDLMMYTGLDDVVQENLPKLAGSSPTKAIIEAFLHDGGDVETLVGALEAANLIEAHSVLKRNLRSKN